MPSFPPPPPPPPPLRVDNGHNTYQQQQSAHSTFPSEFTQQMTTHPPPPSSSYPSHGIGSGRTPPMPSNTRFPLPPPPPPPHSSMTSIGTTTQIDNLPAQSQRGIPPPSFTSSLVGQRPMQQEQQQQHYSTQVNVSSLPTSSERPTDSNTAPSQSHMIHNTLHQPSPFPPPPLSAPSTTTQIQRPLSQSHMMTHQQPPPLPSPPLSAPSTAHMQMPSSQRDMMTHQPPPPLPHPTAHMQMPSSQSHLMTHQPPPPPPLPQMPSSQSHMMTHHHQPPPPPPHHPTSHMQMPSSQSHIYPPTTHRIPPPQQQGSAPYHDTIDTSQIPRPWTDNISQYHPRAQMGQPPPLHLSSNNGVVMDDGNAVPNILRSTVYQFPSSRAQWHTTGDIPLALECIPLAIPSQDFVPSFSSSTFEHNESRSTNEMNSSIPILPITHAPPRCTNCLAYANPFATDTKCIFCGTIQSQTLVTSRPEATVEWEVTGPYITRDTPVQPVQLYVLDLTCPYVEEYKSMLQELGQDMVDHWQLQQQQMSRTVEPRIGVCFVSSMGIVIPQRNHTTGEITCMVVADVTEDPFTPVPLNEWTFVMNESADMWTQFLEQLDIKLWRKQAFGRNSYGLDGSELSCGGAALAFLSNALALTGGRGTLLTWRRPNFGVGTLAFREESQALLLGRSQVENTLTYVPVQLQSKPEGKEDEAAAAFYTKLAEECVKNRVTLDVVMHTGPVSPNHFLGLASIGELCRVTSGSLNWIQAVEWYESLYNELRNKLRAFTGWDAVFKVRCSTGVQVKQFICPPGKSREGSLGDSPEIELSSLSPHTCISVELDHRVGGIPKTSTVVFFQTALLYTSLSGRRLVRVSTLAIPIARSVNDVFQGADFSAILPYLVRTSYTHLIKSINEQQPKKDEKTAVARQKARDALYARCLNILVNYRQHTPAISSPTGQLLLPSRLQLLPLFCMCLLKRPILVPGFPCRDQSSAGARIQPSGDERGYFNLQLLQSNPSTCMLLLYPTIYAIDLNASDHGTLPPIVRPSMESFQDDGIYLVDDGLRLFMYMGHLVPNEIKDEWIHRRHEALNTWLFQLRTMNRPNYPAVIPVLQQSGHQGLREIEILNLMVEDASAGEKDYVAFLTHIHRDIRNRLQSKK